MGACETKNGLVWQPAAMRTVEDAGSTFGQCNDTRVEWIVGSGRYSNGLAGQRCHVSDGII